VLLLWAASIVEPMAFLVACHLTNKYACLLGHMFVGALA